MVSLLATLHLKQGCHIRKVLKKSLSLLTDLRNSRQLTLNPSVNEPIRFMLNNTISGIFSVLLEVNFIYILLFWIKLCRSHYCFPAFVVSVFEQANMRSIPATNLCVRGKQIISCLVGAKVKRSCTSVRHLNYLPLCIYISWF